MTSQQSVTHPRIVDWLLRIGFFAVGAFMLVQAVRSDYFGPHGPIQGTLLILLSFLVGAVTQQGRVGWAMLTITGGCTVLPRAGLGLIFVLASGNQAAPRWGGVGFWMVVVGIVGFYPSAGATMLVALLVPVTRWRDRHGPSVGSREGT